ncbi:hypothetical protein [Micromonospora peucetia]|uniref:Uncharacterized protein n=1 Tax=Micromonospora peucetia TaxID=47871 RepID=A0ABZ1EJW6_9ACTN|nr:hypothetical protein [Micromonospora peucetia]WSA34557.1 hypothetical protein OIE14_11185 [Micromonospora peucetia]
MAWSTPLTAVSNSALTAAQWNASVRDNLLMTAPALATAAGRIFVTTGLNALAERAVGSATINTQETTTSGSYTDLATVGPTVTLTTGTNVIVILTACLFNSVAGSTAQMGFQVSGATSVAPSLNQSLIYESSASADISQMSVVVPVGGLTAGTNTFTAKYRADPSGTATFLRRSLLVLPFG